MSLAISLTLISSRYRSSMETLYENEIVPAIHQGLCGAILTQLSDVEDETNGLLTYDRQKEKVSEDRMKTVAEKLYSAFEKTNHPKN